MSLFITSLNSGSNGNCYYIGNQNEAILVDAGISCREIEKRLRRLGLSMQKVKAVFISHEHTDHIGGLPSLVKKYQIPVYITAPTLRQSGLALAPHQVIFYSASAPILVGGLSIVAFPKCHDACDPYSFVVCYNQVKVGVFTDIGIACEQLVKHFKQCHAAFLESNYDDAMLEAGSYPYFLKKRIRGGKGHLSNKQALDLFITHRPAFMRYLFLSHLSKNNNCPQLVEQLFSRDAKGVKMIIASRERETAVYHIYGSTVGSTAYRHPVTSSQLSFAF